MNEQHLDETLRSWARSRGARPAPAVLRQLVTDIPSDEDTRRQRWLPGFRSKEFRTVFSAMKYAAAAAIVALFGGFLVMGFLTTRPSEEPVPAIASTDSHSPDPGATRVAVPEEGFAVTFPAGWATEVRPVDETGGSRLGAFGTSADGEAFCEAVRTRVLSEDEVFVPWMEPWYLTAEHWEPDLDSSLLEESNSDPDVALPAGRAFRIDATQERPVTSYFLAEGRAFYALRCGPGSSEPDDQWLSIAETFELLDAERLPTGEVVLGRPVDTDVLLSLFITETVEPHVTWVVYDNERDLTDTFDAAREIVAGRDGSVWLASRGGSFPLGGEGFDWGDTPVVFDVGIDGTAWAVGSEPTEPRDLRSFDYADLQGYDYKEWTLRKTVPEGGTVDGVTTRPDGSIWAWWSDADGMTTFGRLTRDGWHSVASIELAVHDEDEEWGPLVALADDAIWALTGDPVHLVSHDGSDWQEQETPEGAKWMAQDRGITAMTVGPNGELWLETCVDRNFGGCASGLARYDETGWRQWSWVDDPPYVEGVGQLRPWAIEGIGPDGTLWFAADDGVVSFDGTGWSHYLQGLTANTMDVAPDGSVWVVAGEQRQLRDEGGLETDYGPVEIYVIRP